MKSLFFGPDNALYGSLHEPSGAAKDHGVLLCCPGPQEYHMTHWAFRRLATQLARAGLATLRFDYSCTGDSAGAAHDAKLDQWEKDVVTAAAELKGLTGLRKLSVVGMRLGAVVAARAVAHGLKAQQLVLWEPVVSGSLYLKQLEELDAREALRLLHRVTEPRTELGGYLVTRRQREELERVDLGSEVPRAAQTAVLLCGPDQESQAREVHQRWNLTGATVEVVREEGSVTGAADRDTAVLYTAMLQAMTERLTGARA